MYGIIYVKILYFFLYTFVSISKIFFNESILLILFLFFLLVFLLPPIYEKKII